MATVDRPDPLSLAARALRDAPDPADSTWPQVAERLSRRVRTLSRPGRPLLVSSAARGQIRLLDRVMVDALRRRLAQVEGARPVGIRVQIADEHVTRVSVEVWVRFGERAQTVADRVRSATSDYVVSLWDTASPVDVEVTDVEPA